MSLTPDYRDTIYNIKKHFPIQVRLYPVIIIQLAIVLHIILHLRYESTCSGVATMYIHVAS